jgi:thiol:disulfide interchange protein/DsbC/DsbD-like thiol-disulfide interchange protein
MGQEYFFDRRNTVYCTPMPHFARFLAVLFCVGWSLSSWVHAESMSSFSLGGSLSSPAGSPTKAAPRHAFVQWIASQESVEPGARVLTGLWVQLEPGWHVYWKNPGDAGLPIRMESKLPAGFSADSILWPTPEPIHAPPLMNYGYEGSVIFPIWVQTPKDFVGTATLKSHAKWLVCNEICLPEQADLEWTLSASVSGTPAKPSAFAPDLHGAIQRLPLDKSPWPLEVAVDSAWVHLRFTPPESFRDTTGVWFFPESGEWMEHAAPESLAIGSPAQPNQWSLRLKRSMPGGEMPPRMRGLLTFHSPVVQGQLSKSFVVDLAWPASVKTSAPAPAGGAMEAEPGSSIPTSGTVTSGPQTMGGFWNLFVKLALAFAGGLILNLMPCVLPVLSLKIFDFVQRAGHARWKVFAHGLTFTFGVLVSFWFLAGLLLVLRQGGEKLGWGYQLQSPPFLVVLCALFFFFSLNLFGVFEMGYFFTRLGKTSGHGESGHLGSFLAGVTATVVATPCTAPFMGSAMGFAFTQSTGVALMVFTFVGLGMASPYLLLSGFPGLMRILPKPGEWMEHLKQFMGFPLLGTAIWLAWILGRQAGLEALIALLATLLLAGISAWILGKWAALHQEKPIRIIAILAALVVFVPAFVLVLLFVQQSQHRVSLQAQPGITSQGEWGQPGGWEPFNSQKAQALIDAGKPLFIDFTADWCLSCKVNERVALENAAVRAKLAAKGVSLMKADWTRSDEAITQALAGYGRQSVPLYVLYPGPSRDKMRILPEILTPSIVLDALDSVVSPATGLTPNSDTASTGIL